MMMMAYELGLLGRLRLSYAINRVPIEQPRTLEHVTVFNLDQQDESSRPLLEAIASFTGFTRVTDVINSDSQQGT